MVGINNVEKRMKQYPHEFSGGMRQRVMIAMGLICHPQLLIADEPTTALDVTIQAQILELMKELQKKTNMGIIFITHNLGVVADICDKVSVMYAGRMAVSYTHLDVYKRQVYEIEFYAGNNEEYSYDIDAKTDVYKRQLF